MAGAFFVFYNSTRSFLGSNGFNPELLPALQFISDDLDLKVTPISKDMPWMQGYCAASNRPAFWTLLVPLKKHNQ
jgi:hypothetical protein